MPIFTHVLEAVAHPNACLCQNTSGPFIDMGLDRWGEQIYVCHRCVQQIFEVYEHVPRDVHDREMQRLDEANAKVTTLGGELEAAQAKARSVEAANERLSEDIDGLRQERAANEAAYIALGEELKYARNGTQSLEHAKAEIAKPPKRMRAPANA